MIAGFYHVPALARRHEKLRICLPCITRTMACTSISTYHYIQIGFCCVITRPCPNCNTASAERSFTNRYYLNQPRLRAIIRAYMGVLRSKSDLCCTFGIVVLYETSCFIEHVVTGHKWLCILMTPNSVSFQRVSSLQCQLEYSVRTRLVALVNSIIGTLSFNFCWLWEWCNSHSASTPYNPLKKRGYHFHIGTWTKWLPSHKRHLSCTFKETFIFWQQFH